MAKKKSKKAKIAVSIDPVLLGKIREFVDETERSGGVSGVLEQGVRLMFRELKQMEAPHLLGRLESLQYRLEELNWKKECSMSIDQGFDPDLEYQIYEMEKTIARVKMDVAMGDGENVLHMEWGPNTKLIVPESEERGEVKDD